MKKIIDLLFSMRFTAVLFLTIAIAIAMATFIENDFGSQGARAMVYNATWFEIVIALFTINLAGNIFRYKMYKKEKLSLLIFHVSFIVIIFGAALTRFFGYEGTMHIREAESSDTILSSDTYLRIVADQDGKRIEHNIPVLFSAATDSTESFTLDTPKGEVTIATTAFYQNAAETVVEDEHGKPYLNLIVSDGQQPQSVDVFAGEVLPLSPDLAIAFENDRANPERSIQIRQNDDGSLSIQAPDSIQWMSMDTRETGSLAANEPHPIQSRHLYGISGFQMVLKNYLPKAAKQLVDTREKTGVSALKATVTYKDKREEVTLYGSGGTEGNIESVDFGDTRVSLSYGSVRIALPFALKLDAFVLERYPGSMSPSSYESHVSVIDEANGVHMPYHIYMNHILVYEGFRFYQSSYDPDELGTILSVAHDPGMIPTYIGYFLMTVGLIWVLFARKARFRQLADSVNKSAAAFVLAVLALGSTPSLHATVAPEHAENFARLLVQDVQGRIKPMDTLTMEFMNKVHRGYQLDGLSANQVVLSMLSSPQEWQTKKLVRVSNDGVNALLGVDPADKYLAFREFFDANMNYLLRNALEEVNRKRPVDRGKLDKELLKVDERANICFMVYNGDLFRLFPSPNTEDTRWYSPREAMQSFPKPYNDQVQQLTLNYLNAVGSAQTSGDWSGADKALDDIRAFQSTHGEALFPHPAVIKAELISNDFNIFERLAPIYGIIGLVLMVILFVSIINNHPVIKLPVKAGFYLLLAAFIAHTAGLGLRWYISGHAPWSNGYESLIYISWATVLAGLFFSRKSSMTLAATSILAALTLFVAHLSWMDPQITNLVPVLKSYWLTIHVSIISASYGFLALGALLGFITMILFIFRKETKAHIDKAIKELTKINEMSIIIGLVMLSIGNMLGAVWANESWGRYWSWDAKETWTLVSIMVYAFVVHTRFIPKMKTAYFNAVASTVAFASIIMTYFGVNYYLSGMHSYAAGDPIPVPSFVYYTIFVVTLVALFASRKRDSILPLQK